MEILPKDRSKIQTLHASVLDQDMYVRPGRPRPASHSVWVPLKLS